MMNFATTASDETYWTIHLAQQAQPPLCSVSGTASGMPWKYLKTRWNTGQNTGSTNRCWSLKGCK